MTRRLAILATLAACGGGKGAPAAAPAPVPAAEAELRFDWSPPCSVPVTERAHRKGADLTMSYTVSVTRLGDGELLVDMVDIDVLEVNGTDLRGPEHAADRAQIRDLFAAFPALIVDDAGNYLRTEGLDEVIEATIRSSPELAEARSMFDSPEMRAQMSAKFAEPWLTWVGQWVDWSLALGDRATVRLTTPGPSGEELPFDATVEHLVGEDGLAHLRYTERMDGDALKVMMAPMLASMSGIAPDPAEAEKFFDEMTLEGYRETVFEVETSPENLRPRRSRHEIRFEATINGAKPERQLEWREYEFDWDHAVGCGR